MRRESATWWWDDDNARIGLAITTAGLAAIGVDEPEGAKGEARADTGPVDTPSGGPGGKLGAILAVFETEDGATIGELADAAAWQPHTTRAALNRLRQRGFDIRLEAIGKHKAYRLHGAV